MLNKFRRPVGYSSILVAIVCLRSAALLLAAENQTSLRPPSVPLIACDPYFSIWSPADKLTDSGTVHWTGKPHRLTSLARIDGKGFRIMGKEPSAVPPLPQKSVSILPTRTIYAFEAEGVELTVTFMTASLPEELDLYSRPVTYLTWEARAIDGREHKVSVYFDAMPEIAADTRNEEMETIVPEIPGLSALGVGTVGQPVLQKKGDDRRIDWGHFYVAIPGRGLERKDHEITQMAWLEADRGAYPEEWAKAETVTSAHAPARFSLTNEYSAQMLGIYMQLGLASSKPVSRYAILAYDDEFSIQYFKHNLRPYWRRNGDDGAALLKKAAAEYESLKKRCEKFDVELMSLLTKAGGIQYANLCALAYRQCYAANKVVADANGQPLMFPKENFSNGCIGTVDVIYPMIPQFLFFSPSLTKATLVPIMDYASSSRWHFPFAPHDLGTYPLANGQVYGGGERNERNQMPVEETGNMLIMLAALAQIEGNADFCARYWPILDKWADYLKAKGFDPENQLCTDDFAGHLAHNVNLSAKAICGLGAYAKLCEMHGEKAKARELMQMAKEFATRWAKEADDGDHFRLAFDKPDTWSQKYNLVWDRILGLNLFPDSIRRKEMDFYKTKQNDFGLPLDNRKDYTKLDWTLWTATLTQDRKDFDALVSPVFKFLNGTPDRVPMTDWFNTKTAKKSGFQARSVVGGVFLQMLYDRGTWKKWAKRDVTKSSNWAPFPSTDNAELQKN